MSSVPGMAYATTILVAICVVGLYAFNHPETWHQVRVSEAAPAEIVPVEDQGTFGGEHLEPGADQNATMQYVNALVNNTYANITNQIMIIQTLIENADNSSVFNNAPNSSMVNESNSSGGCGKC